MKEKWKMKMGKKIKEKSCKRKQRKNRQKNE